MSRKNGDANRKFIAGKPLKNLSTNLLKIIILCFCASILCFLDRVNISVAAHFIMAHYGWNETQMGIIFSAFFAGYVIFMIPGGVLADRYGPKRVLTAGVTFWSVFTILNPLFSRIWSMSLCRYMVGTGQGVYWPAVNTLIARHVSVYDRTKVIGFILSGAAIGSVIGFPVGSWIIRMWGWHAIFYVFGFVFQGIYPLERSSHEPLRPGAHVFLLLPQLCRLSVSGLASHLPDPGPWVFAHRYGNRGGHACIGGRDFYECFRLVFGLFDSERKIEGIQP